jgi:hypothetical protein
LHPDVGPVEPPSLTNPLSPFFERKQWEVTDTEYKILLPSLRLASHWISVALPYIVTFLPSSRLHANLRSSKRFQIESKKNVTRADIDLAKTELKEIAESVIWQIDAAMRANHDWLGITRMTDEPRPWLPIQAKDILKADFKAMQERKKRRPLIVGVMKEVSSTCFCRLKTCFSNSTCSGYIC